MQGFRSRDGKLAQMCSLFVACVALVAPCVVLRFYWGVRGVFTSQGPREGRGRASVSRTGRRHSGLFNPQVDTPDFTQEIREFRSLASARLAQREAPAEIHDQWVHAGLS